MCRVHDLMAAVTTSQVFTSTMSARIRWLGQPSRLIIVGMEHTLTLSEDQMWRAFEDKDAAYDNQFFVAVRTTRIYCRPSCPARPLRKNVVFFPTWQAAEDAGFRACKRCHPKQTFDNATTLAQRAAELIQADGTARLDQLSAALHISPFHLQRTFKKVMGVSPLQYARAQRIQQVKQELKTGTRVTDAVYNAGFNSSSRLYEQAAGIGMTPGAYQKGGQGMNIDYTIIDSALGRMLIAGTPRGLCALYLGDDDATLERELAQEYPAARIQRHPRHDHTALHQWAEAVTQYLNQEQPHAALAQLPLDVQGTAFQARVWQALRTIPEGETRSYSELAHSIGQPTAVRAVANACGANHVAVVIPCHRAVRQGKGNVVGGYRWGTARKAKLLAQEHAVAPAQDAPQEAIQEAML